MNMQTLYHIEKTLSRDPGFRRVRKRIRAALKDNPKSISLEDALLQQKQFSSLSSNR